MCTLAISPCMYSNRRVGAEGAINIVNGAIKHLFGSPYVCNMYVVRGSSRIRIRMWYTYVRHGYFCDQIFIYHFSGV